MARLGLVIGAPVCEPQLVRIEGALVGWEFRPGSGRLLEEGWAHGSLAVAPAVETRDVTQNRATDDNARRQAGVYALHDWCAGADGQWLMVGSESEFYSHDHGHYFPDGPPWTIPGLQQAASSSYALAASPHGLDARELERLADEIEGVSAQEIAAVMSNLPADWPVQDDELEALVDFVHARRPEVGGRLRALARAV